MQIDSNTSILCYQHSPLHCTALFLSLRYFCCLASLLPRRAPGLITMVRHCSTSKVGTFQKQVIYTMLTRWLTADWCCTLHIWSASPFLGTPILYTQPCVKCNRFIIYTTDQTTLCICNEYLIYTTSADGNTRRTKSVTAKK